MSSNVFEFDEQDIEITDYTDIDSDVKVLIVTAVTDAVMNQIAGGNTGEVLSKNSNADNDFIWISVAKTIEKKIVVTDNEPYSGAEVGNAYLEITASNGNKSYIALIYDELKYKPIIQQDLDSLLFTPVINTYYKHIGTSEGQFWNGVIYFYDGESYSIVITKKQADDLYVHKTVNNTNRFAYIRDFGTETILPISQAAVGNSIVQRTAAGAIQVKTASSEPEDADLTAINAWFLSLNYYNKIQIQGLLAGKQDNLTESQLTAVNSGIDGTKVAQIAANKNNIDIINSKIPVAASSSNKLVDYTQMVSYALPLSTRYAKNSSLSYDDTTGELTLQLKDQNGENLSVAQTITISLPSLETAINNILALIPQQASEENQLADKAFVNSSIATNTANFLGTYNIVTDLGLTTSATESQIAAALALKLSQLSITVTNNDYVYVAYPNATQPQQFDRYDRYKFIESSDEWKYEFTLNNSSFTAEQWAAINSSITAELVGTYSAHVINTNNPHNVTKTQVGLSNVDNVQQYSASNPNFGSATPLMNGTGSVGTATTYARSDHEHPSDTSKVDKNADIPSGTNCKISYDSKGLVTAGSDLVEDDIPTLSIKKISGLQSVLDNLVPTSRTIAGLDLSQDRSKADMLTALGFTITEVVI